MKKRLAIKVMLERVEMRKWPLIMQRDKTIERAAARVRKAMKKKTLRCRQIREVERTAIFDGSMTESEFADRVADFTRWSARRLA